MADRYWVGGTANWDGTAGAKWSATSGGAGGEAIPTSADDVFFDANSGAVTVTVAFGETGCGNLDFTGFTGTFAGSESLNAHGSVTLGAGMTITYIGVLVLDNAGAASFTSNGKALIGNFTFRGGGTLTLQDAFASGNINLNNVSTLDTNDQLVTTGSLLDSTNNCIFTLGASTLNLTGPAPMQVSAGSTVNAGTSTINCSHAAPTFNGNNRTFHNLVYSKATGGGTLKITGSNTFNSLQVTNPPQTILFTAGTTTTIVADDGFPSGTSGNVVTIGSVTAANHSLVKSGDTANGNVLCDFLSISRSQASPVRTWLAGANSTDGGNNTGWRFSSALAPLAGLMAFFAP